MYYISGGQWLKLLRLDTYFSLIIFLIEPFVIATCVKISFWSGQLQFGLADRMSNLFQFYFDLYTPFMLYGIFTVLHQCTPLKSAKHEPGIAPTSTYAHMIAYVYLSQVQQLRV